jgi:MFS family permease
MDSNKDEHFRRNVFAVAAVEMFWGLGFPVVLESTFLQLFLRHLGASGFVIGLVPSIFFTGISCFPIFAGYLTRNIRLKKKAVLTLHLFSGLAVFIYGWTILIIAESAILPAFFVAYILFSFLMGLTIPVWLNYLVRIFSEKKAVPGLGYMMLAQNIGKILSGVLILKIVDKYSFSTGSCAAVFIITGLLFVTGSLFFAMTRELPDKDDPPPDSLSFLNHTRHWLRDILSNRRFMVFLAADLDFYVIVTVLSFYADYATRYFAVDQAVAAGGFVACIYAGSVTVNIFLGTLNFLNLKNKFILSKCITLATMLLLVTIPHGWSFFIISYLLGAVRAIRNMVYSPSVKKLSAKTDATPYFALAPVLTLPFGFGFPLIFGRLLDHFAYLGADSYRLLFAFSAAVVGVTFYFTMKTRYDSPR